MEKEQARNIVLEFVKGWPVEMIDQDGRLEAAVDKFLRDDDEGHASFDFRGLPELEAAVNLLTGKDRKTEAVCTAFIEALWGEMYEAVLQAYGRVLAEGRSEYGDLSEHERYDCFNSAIKSVAEVPFTDLDEQFKHYLTERRQNELV